MICLLTSNVFGQTQEEKYQSKVASIDSIIFNLYDVISGEKTEERDWELFKYLFKKEARLISTRKKSNDKDDVYFMTVDDYIENATAFFKQNNFFEKEIFRKSERFGSLVHVWSTYETLNKNESETPIARGINSIQLFNDGTRWWIVNIYWTSESSENKIPEQYLPL